MASRLKKTLAEFLKKAVWIFPQPFFIFQKRQVDYEDLDFLVKMRYY